MKAEVVPLFLNVYMSMSLPHYVLLRTAPRFQNIYFVVGVKTGYQARKMRIWKDQGNTVLISKSDIGTEEGARALVAEAKKLGPVGGFFNLAMVILYSYLMPVWTILPRGVVDDLVHYCPRPPVSSNKFLYI